MEFTEKDLEEILKIALVKANEKGLHPDLFKSVFYESVEGFLKEKADSVEGLYPSIPVDSFYIESFQMGDKRKGGYPKEHIRDDNNRCDWRYVEESVDAVFDTKFTTDSNRSYHNNSGKAFVWLEKSAGGKGILYSYGLTHLDCVHRKNKHYFAVVSDYDKLNEAVKTFKANPLNIIKFTKIMFDWKNEPTPKSFPDKNDAEPNLYPIMTELNIYTPETDQKKIRVEK